MHQFALLTALVAITFSRTASPATIPQRHLQVQAHRGGAGMRPESTLFAFANALELGVDVLEMDTVFTSDGIPIIWHDHQILASKCLDTTGTHVGKFIANLTLAEVKTLDCGSLGVVEHPLIRLAPGARIATLEEVLHLVSCYGDADVEINLETKLDPTSANETFGADKYITDIVPLLQRRGFANRTTIQSFDWRTLVGIKQLFPEMRTVALVDETTLVRGDKGQYEWLAGIDLERGFGGDFVAAAAWVGAGVVSAVHGLPSNATVEEKGYVPFTDAGMVRRAHELGMKVLPWTVNDEATIAKLIDDGVDGIISNYPERVMAVGRRMGLRVGRSGRKARPECLKNAGGSPGRGVMYRAAVMFQE